MNNLQSFQCWSENATRLIVAALCLAVFALNGCDNRTSDAKRWDQIAETQKKDKNVQPWYDARRRRTEFKRSQPDRSQIRNLALGTTAKAPELPWIFTEAFPPDLSVALAGILSD
jgi:hypothetical protein